MKHRNPATEKLTSNFERFNPYAAKALEGGDDADVYAFVALAFEMSQLRYQLMRGKVDMRGIREDATRHEHQ